MFSTLHFFLPFSKIEQLKLFKFNNETFNFNLGFIIYNHNNKEDYERVLSVLVKSGAVKSELIEVMNNSCGFFYGGNPYYVTIDIDEFDLTTYDGTISLIKTIQHECGHVRGEALLQISEDITVTDAESHLRISDWAFEKCLGTLFMKCLFKLQPKGK